MAPPGRCVIKDPCKADVFDYIERFYNPEATALDDQYMSPVDFEMKAGLP
jgi:hypothetical protein